MPMRWLSLPIIGIGLLVAVQLLFMQKQRLSDYQGMHVSQQRQLSVDRGKFKVLTFFSSNFGEMTSNWWHYLRPYAEESDVDVIAVAFSEEPIWGVTSKTTRDFTRKST
eukprot:Selendium_serpulae@DN6413_c1_g1_i2.p1